LAASAGQLSSRPLGSKGEVRITPLELSKLTPGQVLLPGSIPRYNRGMLAFALQLTNLNVDIFILDHLLSFPFHLFPAPGGNLFFRMVVNNFLSASVLATTRVAGDQDPDFFTIPKFKNWLLQVVRPEYATEFRRHLRQLRFATTVRDLLRKAMRIRHRHIAHIFEEESPEPKQADILTFGELKTIRDSLNLLFAGLAFGTEHLFLPVQYLPNVQHSQGVDARPDIEQLLDLIADHSHLVRLPETHPEQWVYRQATLSERDLRLLNAYRAKFGLHAV